MEKQGKKSQRCDQIKQNLENCPKISFFSENLHECIHTHTHTHTKNPLRVTETAELREKTKTDETKIKGLTAGEGPRNHGEESDHSTNNKHEVAGNCHSGIIS